MFIPNLSGASTSVKIPSLKDVGKTPEEIIKEEDPYIRGTAKDDFTFEDFVKLWSQHAANLKAQGKMNLVTIFNSEAPKQLSPTVFEIVVENKILEDLFKNAKPDLLNYLRTTLRNFDIEVNARVDEQVVVKRPYTSQEKFNHMAAKNPQLAELRKMFNLDFD